MNELIYEANILTDDENVKHFSCQRLFFHRRMIVIKEYDVFLQFYSHFREFGSYR